VDEWIQFLGVAAAIVLCGVLLFGARSDLRARGARPRAYWLSAGLIVGAGSVGALSVLTSSAGLWLAGLIMVALGGLATPLLIAISGGPEPMFMVRSSSAQVFKILKEYAERPDRLSAARETADTLDEWRTTETAPLIDAVQEIVRELEAHGRSRSDVLAASYERVNLILGQLKEPPRR
jgi:hypothetical protein